MLLLKFVSLVFMPFFISPTIQKTALELIRVPYKDGQCINVTLSTIMSYFHNASGRDEIRTTAIENWKTNMLFGVTTDSVLEGYTQQTITNSKGSHDSFIQILATL